jgi:hypothetical protein
MRIAIIFIAVLVLIVPSFLAVDTLPRDLNDQAFWRLISDYSENAGSFRFEYMSNEQQFQYVIPRLKEDRLSGSVYLGVGPEQNFTYIAAIQPRMAFIVDIRRENMIEHLVYKAVFELSTDRADFLSRLFSRKTPAGLTDKTPVRTLFQAFRGSQPSPELYRKNLQAIKDQLMNVHQLPLSTEDQASIDYVYRVFFEAGNAFSSSSGGFYGGFSASYADLMTATDQPGQARSYLASEENFQIVREMHKKNLIVPIVGDFAGTKALRRVGQYVKDHGSIVGAFYTSNVEQYLFQQDDDWKKFLTNVSTFPLSASSTFIRSSHFAYGDAQPQSFNRSRFIQLLSPIAEVTKAFGQGKITSYEDVIRMSN